MPPGGRVSLFAVEMGYDLLNDGHDTEGMHGISALGVDPTRPAQRGALVEIVSAPGF